jgi:hypothetical protein
MSPGEDGEGGVQTSDMGTVTFQYNLDTGKKIYIWKILINPNMKRIRRRP